MEKSNILYYYIDLLAVFHNRFDTVLHGYGVEDIHQLRVAMKKLRAAQSLVKIAGNGDFKKKDHFAVFSTLFKSAGHVREIQVNRELMAKYNASYILPYREYLRQNERSMVSDLHSAMEEFDFEELDRLNGILMDEIQTISNKKMLKKSVAFISDRLKRARKLKSNSKHLGKLHHLRIDLRETLEILTIMQVLDPAVESPKLQKAIKSLHTRIGDWHDYNVLVGSLKTYIKEAADVTILQRLIVFCKQIQRWNAKRGSKIGQRLDRYITPKMMKSLEKLI